MSKTKWEGGYGHTARNGQMDMDDEWIKGIIIESKTGPVTQIAPCDDVTFLPESM